jgi:hypothetical protein
LGIRIINKRLKRQGKKKDTYIWLKSLDIYNVEADALYGLDNPFSTGLASGLLSMAASFFRVSAINIQPDFFSGKGYLKISAAAEIDMGNTIIEFCKK